MRKTSFILAVGVLLGSACAGGGSPGDGPGTGGTAASGGTTGGTTGGTSGETTGGTSSGAASGGTASGATGGDSSGSGGATAPTGGAGGALPDNDPSCPDEVPEHEGTCFVYPFVVCNYDSAEAPLGDHCICAALKWDCVGCPPEPIHGELACSGYEGETCGGCSCSSDGNSNWDCDSGP